jgi:hypothetical protein
MEDNVNEYIDDSHYNFKNNMYSARVVMMSEITWSMMKRNNNISK